MIKNLSNTEGFFIILKQNFWKIFGEIEVFINKFNSMSKRIKLTEKELNRLVKKIVNEQDDNIDYEFIEADNYAGELKNEMEEYLSDIFLQVIESLPLKDMILKYQNKFRERYPQYVDIDYENYYKDSLLNIPTDFKYEDLSYIMSLNLIDTLSEKEYL